MREVPYKDLKKRVRFLVDTCAKGETYKGRKFIVNRGEEGVYVAFNVNGRAGEWVKVIEEGVNHD